MTPAIRAVSYYVLAGVLVGLFIQTFEIWRWLITAIGPGMAAAVPPTLLVVLLLALAAWPLLRRQRHLVKALPIIVGLVLALVALWLADPEFPAKRVHVAEYVLLSLVVRRAVALDVGGAPSIVLTGLITALFGLHDELAQGLHPDRAFDLADVAVNALSGIAGALVADGIGLFEEPREETTLRVPIGAAIGVAMATAVLVFALPAFRDELVPWWTMTPIFAAGAFWFLDARSESTLPSISVAVWLALLSPLYPALANGTSLVFH